MFRFLSSVLFLLCLSFFFFPQSAILIRSLFSILSVLPLFTFQFLPSFTFYYVYLSSFSALSHSNLLLTFHPICVTSVYIPVSSSINLLLCLFSTFNSIDHSNLLLIFRSTYFTSICLIIFFFSATSYPAYLFVSVLTFIISLLRNFFSSIKKAE